MRKNGKPPTERAIEAIPMYHSHTLDIFGDDPNDARAEINHTAFVRYCERYKEDMLLNNIRVDKFRDRPLLILKL